MKIGILLFLVFIAGASLGSFASAYALDWLTGKKSLHIRSYCDECGHKLAVFDLIPVFSWLILRSKCRYCGRRIPAFHFYVELMCGLLCSVTVWQNGYQWSSLIISVLAVLLITSSAVDIVSHLLPDSLTAASFLCSLGLVYCRGWPSLKSSLFGVILAILVPYILRYAFHKLRHKDALGLGDIKLYTVGGVLCGWQGLPFLFLFSALGGIFYLLFFNILKLIQGHELIRRDEEIPFGPAICAIIFLMALFPDLPNDFYLLTL